MREAILNALVHRDYSIHSENVPVRLEIYRNRLELISSGGLYGKLTLDALGKVRPDTRNSALANILELLHVTENRYSGIPTIYHELEKAKLPPPVFAVRHGEFVVTFKSKIAQVYDMPASGVALYMRSRCNIVAIRRTALKNDCWHSAQCRAPDKRLLLFWAFRAIIPCRKLCSR